MQASQRMFQNTLVLALHTNAAIIQGVYQTQLTADDQVLPRSTWQLKSHVGACPARMRPPFLTTS